MRQPDTVYISTRQSHEGIVVDYQLCGECLDMPVETEIQRVEARPGDECEMCGKAYAVPESEPERFPDRIITKIGTRTMIKIGGKEYRVKELELEKGGFGTYTLKSLTLLDSYALKDTIVLEFGPQQLALAADDMEPLKVFMTNY